jgi:hypothetical protein
LLLFSRQIQAHKIPAIVVEGCNLGLKVYTTLTLDNVMIAETLIPRDVVKDALAVHIDPCFLEAENSACSEVDATVVEIVANGDLLVSGVAFIGTRLYGTHKSTTVLYRADLADIS